MIFRNRFRGRRRAPGEMNKLEAAYAAHLETLRAAGEVEWWAYEPISLKLAPSTHYRPDFLVMLAGGAMEVHEVKGHWEDDARVKIKVAAERFPFAFVAVTRERGAWVFERFE